MVVVSLFIFISVCADAVKAMTVKAMAINEIFFMLNDFRFVLFI